MATKLEENQYLTFVLNKESFAIRILKVKEIIEFTEVTRVPMMPKFIPGVINLRGNVVPIIDLNSLFYKQETEITKRTCIIIIESKNDIGILVNQVNEVIELNYVDPPPSFGAEIHTNFIDGIGKLEDKFILILNLDNLLDFECLSNLPSS